MGAGLVSSCYKQVVLGILLGIDSVSTFVLIIQVSLDGIDYMLLGYALHSI